MIRIECYPAAPNWLPGAYPTGQGTQRPDVLDFHPAPSEYALVPDSLHARHSRVTAEHRHNVIRIPSGESKGSLR